MLCYFVSKQYYVENNTIIDRQVTAVLPDVLMNIIYIAIAFTFFVDCIFRVLNHRDTLHTVVQYRGTIYLILDPFDHTAMDDQSLSTKLDTTIKQLNK